MHFIYPSEPYAQRKVDLPFDREAQAAKKNGHTIHLLNLEALADGRVSMHLSPIDPGPTVYRGWIVPPEQYENLHRTTATFGLNLVNSPEHYKLCHNLPEWYERCEWVTPRSMWIPGQTFDLDDVALKVAEEFRTDAVILKDYIKSQKYYWDVACFIPDASDAEKVKSVVKEFLRLQGAGLSGGLVFRRFEKFERVKLRSLIEPRFPTINEWRAFLWNGSILHLSPSWRPGEVLDYPIARPDDHIKKLAAGVADVPFVVVDVAQTEVGEWKLVEVHDGGIASIPAMDDAEPFYEALTEFSHLL